MNHHHTELNSIDELNIPDDLKKTLYNQQFLIKESIIGVLIIFYDNIMVSKFNFFFKFILGEDKILVFTTVNNIQKLSQAIFWIVDGTFKTVPTNFTQLYTIHAQVSFGVSFK